MWNNMDELGLHSEWVIIIIIINRVFKRPFVNHHRAPLHCQLLKLF